MKKIVLSLAFVCLLANRLQAGVALGTTNPAGTPLVMNSGSISGPMFVTVASDNYPNDIMAAWNFQLEIDPISGAMGTLTFQDPTTGTPSPPANYIFGPDGLGITAVNSGNVLSANDFYDPGVGFGVIVPSNPVANLLQMDFTASSNASGLFGVYTDEGAANTQWTDSNFTTQLFSNVPDGTGMVLIGEVMVNSAGVQPVPEPSSLLLFGLGSTMLAGWNCRRKRPRIAR